MRAMLMMVCCALLPGTVPADEDESRDTVALINAQLAADPFYATHGYSIAQPSICIVDLIPRGSRFGSERRFRIALNVLDRSAVERLRFGPRDRDAGITWVDLVGHPEGTSERKGFPATPELNAKGFPKDEEPLLSYGIELRFAKHDSARIVAQAFVQLATLCLDAQ